MIIYLYLKSKNLNSLKFFFKLFYNFCFKNCINYNKISKISNKVYFFSILKSPHVNKTSQSQFEYREFQKKIVFSTNNTVKTLIILKFFQVNLCSDVNVKIKMVSNSKKTKKFFEPKKSQIITLNNIKYLNMFDIAGERFLTL
jgi:ribosomal protein S10